MAVTAPTEHWDVDDIVAQHDGRAADLVMILQETQARHNYLPEPALVTIAERLAIPLSRVYQVATFYRSFSLTPRGRHVIRICDGTACHLKGALNLQEEIERHLGLTVGGTTPDQCFSLEVVACLGMCAMAPVIAVDETFHGHLSSDTLKQILGTYAEEA